MRGFALGGFGPRRVGGAIEGGKVFDGGGEISHRFFQAVYNLYRVEIRPLLRLFLYHG